jgi:glycosyltransferase involved in cell wall biosynthesis
MKLLVLCYEFPPLGGGGARIAHGLAREMVRQGHAVDLVTMGFRRLPRFEVVDGIRVHRVRSVRLRTAVCSVPELLTYVIAAGWTALRLARRERFDLHHAHFIFPDGAVAWMLRRFTGRRYVITAHGSDVPGYNPNRFRWLHRLLGPLWRAVVRGAERVVCPSRFLLELVRRRTPGANAVVIPNGFDPDRLHPDRAKTKRILLVSRMFERKGVQYFLQALKGLDHDHDVEIVGDGPHLRALRALTDDPARVRFRGWLDNDSPELRALYEQSSIFVFPSTAENFPVVLLEAMASGLAIVTTRGTGSAEVVGETAVMVDARRPESIRAALVELMQHPERGRELGAAARRRLEERFSWAAVAPRYAELFAATLGANGAAVPHAAEPPERRRRRA